MTKCSMPKAQCSRLKGDVRWTVELQRRLRVENPSSRTPELLDVTPDYITSPFVAILAQFFGRKLLAEEINVELNLFQTPVGNSSDRNEVVPIPGTGRSLKEVLEDLRHPVSPEVGLSHFVGHCALSIAHWAFRTQRVTPSDVTYFDSSASCGPLYAFSYLRSLALSAVESSAPVARLT